ncbi:MAG: DegV family protein [Erysipelotrichaceae bacterium]|nr:DegV family protein [Erysipelotrichaceae bacterium]
MEFVPLTVTLQNKSYLDGIELEKNEFYEKLIASEEFPKTSQPTPQAFLDVFEDVKAKGDELICVLLSSTLSGTYQSALLAKDLVDYDHIHLIDSLSATCMNKVIVEEACRLKDAGASVDEIVERIKDLNARVKIVAMVDTLEYIYKGGRLNKTAVSVGEFVKIKPILTLAEDHSIGMLSTCFGKVKAMNYLLKHLEKS